MKLPVSAVILTMNEESNLPSCLSSLEGVCEQVFIVDSGSTDGTAEIARAAGAQVVQHAFETHAKQWNWALQTLPLKSEWVLALDADQALTPELRKELSETLPQAQADVSGYYVLRKQYFRGQWIRHGGYWPKHLLKLFRRGQAKSDERELLDFRFYVDGNVSFLKNPIIELNRKDDDLSFWTKKHLRFIELLAQEEYLRRHGRSGWLVRPTPWGTPDQRILWYKQIWYRMPLYIRPFLYFGYRYFIRMGFLDGQNGTIFHWLQGFWLRWRVDFRLAQIEREKAGQPC